MLDNKKERRFRNRPRLNAGLLPIYVPPQEKESTRKRKSEKHNEMTLPKKTKKYHY
jgi:hypothetical protein